jgi:hypothetical protein
MLSVGRLKALPLLFGLLLKVTNRRKMERRRNGYARYATITLLATSVHVVPWSIAALNVIVNMGMIAEVIVKKISFEIAPLNTWKCK